MIASNDWEGERPTNVVNAAMLESAALARSGFHLKGEAALRRVKVEKASA